MVFKSYVLALGLHLQFIQKLLQIAAAAFYVTNIYVVKVYHMYKWLPGKVSGSAFDL